MNYYEVLRVPTTANLIEIKKAYKTLVKRYHPDIYEGNKLFAEYKIKEINEAYEVLKTRSTKAIYDEELNNSTCKKSDYVKTNPKSDFEKYQNVYKKSENSNSSRAQVKSYPKINFDKIIKKYFSKIEQGYQIEDKQDFIIFLLTIMIIVFSISIIGFFI